MSRYFRESEFDCRCGCGLNNISPDLVALLDEARGLYKKPMVIESGSRCTARNKAEGGKRTSAHLKGLAADIRCKFPRDRFRLVNILLILGFKRVGIGAGFVHADIYGGADQEVMWLY
jgi:uncharacterized protein YcbK (DUF882 family)